MSDNPHLAEKKTRFSGNFLLLAQGAFTSNLGVQVVLLGQALLIKEINGSSLDVAITITLGILPYILFGPFAGVLADYWDRRTTIIWCDILSGLVLALSASLFYLTDSNTIIITGLS